MGNHVSSIAVPLIAAVAAACSPTVGSFFNYVDKVDKGKGYSKCQQHAVKSLMLEVTPSATQFFKRSYKINVCNAEKLTKCSSILR